MSDQIIPANETALGAEHFENDTQKLVRRHLQDKNHIITEEEIRNIKIGVDPVSDENKPQLEEKDQPPANEI